MPLATLTPYTVANRTAQAPNSRAVQYGKILEASDGGVSNPWDNFMGPVGGSSPILIRKDLESGPGDRIHFTKANSLRGPGKRGSVTMIGTEESRRLGTDSLIVDIVRHATALNMKDKLQSATGNALHVESALTMENWLAATTGDFINLRFLSGAIPGANVLYPTRTRNTIDLLTSADTVSSGLLELVAAQMTARHAKPINKSKMKSGAQIDQFLFYIPSLGIQPLYSDTKYSTVENYAAMGKEMGNTVHDGGFTTWRGNGIFTPNDGEPDVNGPIGSHLLPMAKLGVAIASAATAITFQGGGSQYDAAAAVPPDYFRFFPGNQSFTLYEAETIVHNFLVTGDYFLRVENHVESSAGAGDAGKWGLYRFTSTSNTGAVLVSKAETGNATTGAGGRLGAAVTGHTTTMLGAYTYDAAVNTVNHPAGANVFLANAKGQRIGFGICTGAGGAMFGQGGKNIGSVTGDNSKSIVGTKYEEQDYGMNVGVGISAVMGAAVRLDSQGIPRGYIVFPYTW